MSTVYGIQKRMRELGRVRLGDQKGTKGSQRKLDKFRLTSHSQLLLEAAAKLWGGEVQEWEGAPDEGTWELYTQTDQLPVLFPPVYSQRDGTPTAPFSQTYELWSGGGCVRRCDGLHELLSDSPCQCDPEKRACEIYTRVRFMLPDIPEIGTWRMDTQGFNAAMEIPATLDFLAQSATRGGMVPATLRLEQRSSKVDGQTRRYVVPVFDLPGVRVADFLPEGYDQQSVEAPVPGQLPNSPPRPAPRAALEQTTDHPDVVEPTASVPGDFGETPPLPMSGDEPEAAQEEPEAAPTPAPDGTGEDAPDSAPPPPDPEPEEKKKTSEKMATTSDRRLIFQKVGEVGLDEAQVKAILKEVAGVEGTDVLPKKLVSAVITAIEGAAK